MKLLLTSLFLAQVLDLTSAQSACRADLDTYDDGTGTNGARGQRCEFYKGKDCIALAKTRGLDDQRKAILLSSCRHACGFCGAGTIVKECEDDSCQCQDRANWQLTLSSGKKITCQQKTFGGCFSVAMTEKLSDAQVREYFTNCAASCRVCSPCANLDRVGDQICDPGNNNDKCFAVLRTGKKSATFDGGDCCNKDESPFFDGDNSERYLQCTRSNTAYDKQFCKCLSPQTARTNDCVGSFGKFGECSAKCGTTTGVKKKKFIVLSTAKADGHACQFNAGHTVEQSCTAEMKPCPTTTATTPTTTTTTATATTSTARTVVDEDEDDATTATTLITTIACMIYLFF